MPLVFRYRDAWVAETASAFVDEIEALSDRDFLAHFARDRGVVYPLLAPCTPDQLAKADAVLAGRFDLVGEAHALGHRFSWTANPSHDKEWQIAHHKFYLALDLAQAHRLSGKMAYLACWIDLIESWLDEMGSGFITASDAQVEAKRIEHWILSFAVLQGTDWHRHVSARFLRRFLARIAGEAWYVAQNLRPARNHRTFQLYAIFLAGVLFPEFARHRYFVEFGRDALTANLLADFAADGVHVELSSHYHQITLETAVAFVQLARSNKVAIAPALFARLHRALEFSLWLLWPNGDMPSINDSDTGDHRPLLCTGSKLVQDPKLLWAGTQGWQGVPPEACARRFADSGYFVFRDGWGDDPASFTERQHVFYDCARLGEGSHSHYDLFNFTYYLGGQPLIVDPGRYTYCADAVEGIDWRREFKSTAYHNTVTIDRRDQTRYLSKSKTPAPGIERYDRSRHTAKHGPDVEIEGLSWFLGAHSDWVLATARSHEYAPRHTRLFIFMLRQYVVIIDRIEASDGLVHEYDLHFHFAQRWDGRIALEQDDCLTKAAGESWRIFVCADPQVQSRLTSGWVSCSYGVKHPAPVLSVRQTSKKPVCFASVLALHSDRLQVRAAGRDACDRADGGALRTEVLADAGTCQDIFLLRPAGAPPYEDESLRYEGQVLIYRRDAKGNIGYICASHPERLELRAGAQSIMSGKGPVEWKATTAR